MIFVLELLVKLHMHNYVRRLSSAPEASSPHSIMIFPHDIRPLKGNLTWYNKGFGQDHVHDRNQEVIIGLCMRKNSPVECLFISAKLYEEIRKADNMFQ